MQTTNEVRRRIRPSRTKAASALFLTQISAALINLPVTILLARTMGPDSYGEYQFLNRLAIIAVSVICLGYPHAIAWAANKSSSKQEDRSIVRFLLAISTAGGILCAALSVILLELDIQFGSPTAWLVFGLFPIFNLISANLINFFRGKLIASGIAAIKITQALSWLVLCLGLVFTQQLSVVTAAIAMLVSQVVSALAGILVVVFRGVFWGAGKRIDARGITSFSLRVFPGLAVRDLNVYLDQIVIALFLSTRDLGLYAVAVSLTTSLALMSGPVINTVQPIIQSADESEQAETIAKAFAATICVIGIPAASLAIVSPWLAPLVYGDAFSSSVFLIQILCLASFIDALNSCAHGALLGLNSPGRSSWSSSIGLVISVGLWIFLLPALGTTGAALTSVTAYLAVLVFMFAALKSVLSISAASLLGLIVKSVPTTAGAIWRHILNVARHAISRLASKSRRMKVDAK